MNTPTVKIPADIQTKLSVALPDGRILVATDKCDNAHPGIQIAVVSEDGSLTPIVWAEYNTIRPDYSMDERLRLIAWSDAEPEPEEPAINMSYDTGSFETEDKNGVHRIEKGYAAE